MSNITHHALALIILVTPLLARQALAQGFATDAEGIDVSGQVLSEGIVTRNLTLHRGSDSTPIELEASLSKGQVAVFEIEFQDRSGWNNQNVYTCEARDVASGRVLVSGSLPLINISQYGNVTLLSSTSRLTSGTLTWVFSADESAAIARANVVCGGAKYGGLTSELFLRLKKTILETRVEPAVPVHPPEAPHPTG